MNKNKYNLKYTNKFSKDLKLIKKRGYNMKLLERIVEILINKEKLPAKNKDFALKNKYLGYRECFIIPDFSVQSDKQRIDIAINGNKNS